jgi:hypothetical protein
MIFVLSISQLNILTSLTTIDTFAAAHSIASTICIFSSGAIILFFGSVCTTCFIDGQLLPARVVTWGPHVASKSEEIISSKNSISRFEITSNSHVSAIGYV